MPRHTPIAFLLIVGLLFIETTHADELVSSNVETPAAYPKSFIIDFDSASLETRQALGVTHDANKIREAREAAVETLPREPGMVKRSWLIVFDPVAFKPEFFDGPILVELPNGQSCVAQPRKIKEIRIGSTYWTGRCESSIASDDSIVLNISSRKKLITGYMKWGGQYFQINATREKPFHVIFQYELDHVPEKLPVF